MLIAAQKHKERMKDLWSCLLWILFPSACRIPSSSKRAPSLCPPIPAAPHCSGQILPANTPWDPRFGWGSVERRCTGKWCWGLGPAAAVPGPAPGKWGAYKGRGGWLGYPLPAPRQALPKPGGGSDCRTVFGDQLQEMTQGPSVLPNSFTPLGLLAAWLSVLEAASFFPPRGSSPGPAAADAISSSRCFAALMSCETSRVLSQLSWTNVTVRL